jgi:hypothetical protein
MLFAIRCMELKHSWYSVRSAAWFGAFRAGISVCEVRFADAASFLFFLQPQHRSRRGQLRVNTTEVSGNFCADLAQITCDSQSVPMVDKIHAAN